MSLWDRLASGEATVAHAWAVTRTDGTTQGFTDHDAPLAFEGIAFAPGAGLSALALVQGTGLAVDNTEARGALTADGIAEADLRAGRYDGARVRMWLVDWRDPATRALRFEGTLGEVRSAGGAFEAELRGLSEALNRPVGRLYQTTCPAVLGDGDCRADLSAPGLRLTAPAGATDGQVFRLDPGPGFPDRWFERGRLTVLDGAARGLSGVVKHDRAEGGLRRLDLWAPIPAPVAPGDRVRVDPGCDKRPETCGTKFGNILNFRGFPFIPGEDWLMAVPVPSGANDGGPL